MPKDNKERKNLNKNPLNVQESWAWTRWMDGWTGGGSHKLHGHNQESGGGATFQEPGLYILYPSNPDEDVMDPIEYF